MIPKAFVPQKRTDTITTHSSAMRKAFSLWLVLVLVPSAYAQVIVAGPAAAVAIPVDHPLALLLGALGVGASMVWAVRKGLIAPSVIRTWIGATTLSGAIALVVWGDEVRAQLQELQRAFTQTGGQTLAIPVQATGTGPGGAPLGFLPVVFANQSSGSLRVNGITTASWETCYPLGIPSPLPTTPARPGTVCAVGTLLSPAGACWVDVAQLCANASAVAQGGQPSQLVADTATVIEGVVWNGNVLANDTDADGPLLVASYRSNGGLLAQGVGTMTTVAGWGSFAIQANGSFSFTAASPFIAARPFVIAYTTQTGASSTLTINVQVANGLPVANNDAVTVGAGGSATVAVRSNDTDPDSDPLTVTAVTQGANGAVLIDGVTGDPVYTPNAGYSGSDSFTYTITDGRGAAAGATVTVIVTPAVVNQAPVAVADAFTTGINVAIAIPQAALLANDIDAENNTLSLSSVQSPINGTVSITGTDVVFTPASGFEGAASFTYTITDGAATGSPGAVTVNVGSASAPSVLVQKALVVIAQGTGGTSVKFPITTRLVDADGSESLSIRISGVPSGVSFNAGFDLGSGVWQFVESDLPNLAMNLPGSYTTAPITLTVQVTSTEASTGATASSISTVSLKAAFTTVNLATTTSGNIAGTAANEFIQGGTGDNIISGSGGDNIIQGGDGNDTLSASSGSDILMGGPGNDSLNAGSGSNVLVGGPGNDSLTGGSAVDLFVWSLGDQGTGGGPAVDTVQNFATAFVGSGFSGGDILHLRDLLQGEAVGPSNGAGNLANYLHFEISGSNTVIHISHTGGFGSDSHGVGAAYTVAAETQQIVLSGVDLQSLYSGATTDQQIITQLLNNNKLIVD